MARVYQVEQVFTPSTLARLNFIEREGIRNRLTDALRTPGKQLVVYGHTGSGKSTVVSNKLNQLYEDQVITRCTSQTTYEQMVRGAFDYLEAYYVDSKSKSS